MKIIKTCAILTALAGATLGLGACAGDGYDRGYGRTSVSVGVSSGDYYDHHHRRGPDGDRDRDGVPNWADNHPNNPYRP